jgi:hypothetical protein
MKEGRKPFFFEKKNQKTFAPEPVPVKTPGGPEQKVFCGAFLQKSDLLLSS